MYWWHIRRLAGLLKRTLGMEQHSTMPKTAELLQLSEAIMAYGRMLQTHYSTPEAFVEVAELARRFRETPQAIHDAVLILQEAGRAEPTETEGCWKLQCSVHVERGDSKSSIRRVG
jgi:hypothetical protein